MQGLRVCECQALQVHGNRKLLAGFGEWNFHSHDTIIIYNLHKHKHSASNFEGFRNLAHFMGWGRGGLVMFDESFKMYPGECNLMSLTQLVSASKM